MSLQAVLLPIYRLLILFNNMDHMAFVHVEQHLPILASLGQVVQCSLEPLFSLICFHHLITLGVICKLVDKGPSYLCSSVNVIDENEE